MSEKQLIEILKDVRSLLQTHTTAVSQLLDLNKQVMDNREKHIKQEGFNDLLLQKIEQIEGTIKAIGDGIEESSKQGNRNFIWLAIIMGIAGIIGPKILDKIFT